MFRFLASARKKVALWGLFSIILFFPRPARGEAVYFPEQIERELGQFEEYSEKLKKSGVPIFLFYRGEPLLSYHLNSENEAKYRGLLSLSSGIHTENLGLWAGGFFFLSAENGHGDSMTINSAGTVGFVTNIGAPDFTQVYQVFFRQELADRRLRFRVGRLDGNAIFCVNQFGSHLINPAYALIPTTLIPTYPAPALGAAAFYDPIPEISIGAGVFQGSSSIGTSGFETLFNAGCFTLLEPSWKTGWGAEKLPGNYRLGLWYHSGTFPETGSPASPQNFAGNYGIYVMIDQLLYRPAHPAHEWHGLGFFLQLGWAPGDRNQVTRYAGTGLSYRFSNLDSTGFGLSYEVQNGNRPVEIVNAEIFYRVRLTSWLYLQPDAQYFYNPSGPYDNAFVAGFRFLLEL
jgi:porin